MMSSGGSSMRNTEHSFLDGLFQRSIKTFHEAVVREAVLNAVSHRDYRDQASVKVEQTPMRLRISSPGGFPQGVTAENIWQKSVPRNRLLATAMARCGLVERAGYGADFMFGQLLREGKSPPSYEGTDAHEVVVNVDGRVIDDNFRKFLAEVTIDLGRSLQTPELIALEATRREVRVPPLVAACVPSLIKLGLLERAGRGTLVLGRKYQRLLGTAGDYTRRKGLGAGASVALLEQHILEHEGASLSELCAVLPSFSERQVKTLLDGLREKGKAHSLGRTKGTRWYPGPGTKSVAESEE
jgi:ATP-dependent DNA helicase RecG